MLEKLFDFINASTDAYNAVATLSQLLDSNGFVRILEGDSTKLEEGGKYYVLRNGSSLIAFVYSAKASGFNIVASHSDSPSFRVKVSEVNTGAYARVEVEKYGGMILYSWFDRPLSVSGRLTVRNDKGFEVRTVKVDKDLLVIPSLAIHLSRDVNSSFAPNPANDLLPLLGNSGASLMESVAEAAGVCAEDILSHDLFLYNRAPMTSTGASGEFIVGPRLDDLECVFASAEGFLCAQSCASIPVLAVFDNEEVGSETKQGAASTFLRSTLERIAGDRYEQMLRSSFMISADNAHAKHPAHPELSDPSNAPLLNGGVVVKFNANQRYTTDGVSYAVLKLVAERAGIKLQTYCNRADLPGGSTLGSIADTCVSIKTVDIGLPQLAMHSSVETAGAKDYLDMVKLLSAFYSAAYVDNGDSVELI